MSQHGDNPVMPISLRDYLDEIDGYIDDGRHLEAVAHCRHILQHYPHHLDTYRALGKALLEQKKHRQAADVFQRVLSVDPEDFIAHVGMAIAYKEDGLYEQALWHMLRAFELEPYNRVIRSELAALYTARNEPVPALSLTPAAQARLHVRSELFDLAVNELRHLIAGDPTRIDLQTLLAEALWRDQQRVDAVDVCLQVLDHLPHSLKANAILADIWLNTGRLEEAQEFFDRFQALSVPDESSLATTSLVADLFAQEGAPALPDAIELPRLDYVPEALADDVEMPDWVEQLNLLPQEELSPPAAEQPGDALGVGQQAETLTTDWLRSLATPESDLASKVLPGLEEEETPSPPEPDPVTPPGPDLEPVLDVLGDSAVGSDVPEWLSDILSDQDEGTEIIGEMFATGELDAAAARARSLFADLAPPVDVELAEPPESAAPGDDQGAAPVAAGAEGEAGVHEASESGPAGPTITEDQLMAQSSDGPDKKDEIEWDDDRPNGGQPDDEQPFDWLDDLAAADSEGAEGPAPGAGDASLPEWLQEDLAGDLEDQELPDWLTPAPEDLSEPVAGEPDSAGDTPSELGWLDAIAAGEREPVDDIPTLSWSDEDAEAAGELDSAAGWLQGIDDETADDEPALMDELESLGEAALPPADGADEPVAALGEPPAGAGEGAQTDGDHVDSQLVRYDPDETLDVQDAESEAVAESDQVDDWLAALTTEMEEEEPSEAGQPVPAEADMTWIQPPAGEPPTPAVEDESTGEAMATPDQTVPDEAIDFSFVAEADEAVEATVGAAAETDAADWLADLEQAGEDADDEMADWMAEADLEAAPALDDTLLVDKSALEALAAERAGAMAPPDLEDEMDLVGPGSAEDDLDEAEALAWLEALTAEDEAVAPEPGPVVAEPPTPPSPQRVPSSMDEPDETPELAGEPLARDEAEAIAAAAGIDAEEDLEGEDLAWMEAFTVESAADAPVVSGPGDEIGEAAALGAEADLTPEATEALAWLESLATGELAAPEEIASAPVDEVVPAGPPPVIIDGQPVPDLDIEPTEDPLAADETMAWLEELTAEYDEAEVETAGTPSGPAEVEPADAELMDVELADADLADAELMDVEMADVEMADAELMDVEMADVEMADADLADAIPAGPPPVMIDGQPVPDLDIEPTEDPLAADETMAWLEELTAEYDEAELESAGAPSGPAEVELADAEMMDAELADAELADAALMDVEVADVEMADVEMADADLADAVPAGPPPVMIDGQPVPDLDIEPTEDPLAEAEALAWLEELTADMEAGLAAPVDEAGDTEAIPSEVALEAEGEAQVEAPLAADLDLAGEIPEDPDEAMAWIESLATDTESGTPEEGLDWLDEVEAATPAEAVADPEKLTLAEAAEQVGIDPEWLDQTAVDEPATDAIVAEAAADAAESDEWAIEDQAEIAAEAELSTDDVAEVTEAMPEMADLDVTLGEKAVTDALPDWLQVEATGEDAGPGIDWLDSLGDSDIAEWLTAEEEATRSAQFDADSLAEAGAVMADTEPVAVEDDGALAPKPAPSDEGMPAMMAAEPTVEAAVEPAGPPATVEPIPPPPEMDRARLETARQASMSGDTQRALDEYRQLLEAGQGLPTLITDLEAARTANADPLLVRLLGDVYMRQGQLQKALDSYRQALDLM